MDFDTELTPVNLGKRVDAIAHGVHPEEIDLVGRHRNTDPRRKILPHAHERTASRSAASNADTLPPLRGTTREGPAAAPAAEAPAEPLGLNSAPSVFDSSPVAAIAAFMSFSALDIGNSPRCFLGHHTNETQT